MDADRRSRQEVDAEVKPNLESWYSSLGFAGVESVSELKLPRIQEIDIMG
jgi:hypothetical protein